MPKNVSSASRVTAPALSPTPTGYIGLSVSRRRTPESFQRQQLSGRAPLRTRVGQSGCESLVQQVLSVARRIWKRSSLLCFLVGRTRGAGKIRTSLRGGGASFNPAQRVDASHNERA